MKTNLQNVAGILFGVLLAANLTLAGTPPEYAIIQVKGLACPFCVAGLEKHLKRIPGVEHVEVSLKKGEANVQFKSGTTVTEKQLRQAVKEAGFTAGKIQIKKGSATQPGDTESSGGQK